MSNPHPLSFSGVSSASLSRVSLLMTWTPPPPPHPSPSLLLLLLDLPASLLCTSERKCGAHTRGGEHENALAGGTPPSRIFIRLRPRVSSLDTALVSLLDTLHLNRP